MDPSLACVAEEEEDEQEVAEDVEGLVEELLGVGLPSAGT